MARRPRHPAVIDVAHNRNMQALQRLLMFQDRVSIQQRLRRMLVHPIPGIHHGYIEVLRHQVWRARQRMTNHNDVRPNRPQRVARIEQRLALLNARPARLHQRGHRPHRLRRNFEGRTRPGGRLVEQQHDALAFEQCPRPLRIHPPRQLQKLQDFGRLEMFNAEERSPRDFLHGCPKEASVAHAKVSGVLSRMECLCAVPEVMNGASYAPEPPPGNNGIQPRLWSDGRPRPSRPPSGKKTGFLRILRGRSLRPLRLNAFVFWYAYGSRCALNPDPSTSLPVFRAYPSQASTGNRGYFGNRESVKESSHITNTEPRSDSIRRACWQSAHKPAFVLSKLSLPVTDFARVLLRPKADRNRYLCARLRAQAA